MLVELKNVRKTYKTGSVEIVALNDVSFEIDNSELVVILGKSGAGKSTLLNILGGMDRPTSGNVIINNLDISLFNEKQMCEYRRKSIGFVFQFYNLMPNLTAIENVKLSESLADNPIDSLEILKSVGLEKRMYNFPNQLSGGEQQRVSIARALVKNPTILLCDEPTGALDSKTGKQIISLLKKIKEENNKTVIIVTHNAELAKIADRIIRVSDGSIESNLLNQPLSVDDIEW